MSLLSFFGTRKAPTLILIAWKYKPILYCDTLLRQSAGEEREFSALFPKLVWPHPGSLWFTNKEWSNLTDGAQELESQGFYAYLHCSGKNKKIKMAKPCVLAPKKQRGTVEVKVL